MLLMMDSLNYFDMTTTKEKDLLISNFYNLSYRQWSASPKHLMHIARKVVNDYYDDFDLDDLMTAGGRFDLGEIHDELVKVLQEIEKNR